MPVDPAAFLAAMRQLQSQGGGITNPDAMAQFFLASQGGSGGTPDDALSAARNYLSTGSATPPPGPPITSAIPDPGTLATPTDPGSPGGGDPSGPPAPGTAGPALSLANTANVANTGLTGFGPGVGRGVQGLNAIAGLFGYGIPGPMVTPFALADTTSRSLANLAVRSSLQSLAMPDPTLGNFGNFPSLTEGPTLSSLLGLPAPPTGFGTFAGQAYTGQGQVPSTFGGHGVGAGTGYADPMSTNFGTRSGSDADPSGPSPTGPTGDPTVDVGLGLAGQVSGSDAAGPGGGVAGGGPAGGSAGGPAGAGAGGPGAGGDGAHRGGYITGRPDRDATVRAQPGEYVVPRGPLAETLRKTTGRTVKGTSAPPTGPSPEAIAALDRALSEARTWLGHAAYPTARP